MKVYIIYYKDGFNEYSTHIIDKVFSSLDKACQYVVEKRLKHSDFYKGYNGDELMKAAVCFVETVDVE
jgi:hypothetical protein